MKLTAAFILLGLTVAQAQTRDYSFKESYRMSGDATLRVSSSDGNIAVMKSEGSEIEVFYEVRRGDKTLKIDRKAVEKELELTVTSTSNSLDIVVKYPKESWSLKSWDRMSINFEIHVPAKTSGDLHTSDGNVAVSGLTGKQTIKTSDGNIAIDHITGDVAANTSDGNVSISDIRGSVDTGTSDGNVRLEDIDGNGRSTTSDGDIDLNNITGDAYAKTSDGHITFSGLSGSFSGFTSDGNIRGNLVQLKKELTAKTGDGNISISIPAKMGLDLNIKGESLDVPLDNFSGQSDEKSIRGKSNGGGIPVNLSTSDGNISLTYR